MRSELGIGNCELGLAFQPVESEQACESFEAAMHYDCRICKKECSLRKGPSTTSERIAVACCMLFCVIIVVAGIIQGVNYLMENVL